MAAASTHSGTHAKKSVFFMHIHRKRSPLGNLGITLLPDQIAILPAFQAFGPDGYLVDPKQEAKVMALSAALAVRLK